MSKNKKHLKNLAPEELHSAFKNDLYIVSALRNIFNNFRLVIQTSFHQLTCVSKWMVKALSHFWKHFNFFSQWSKHIYRHKVLYISDISKAPQFHTLPTEHSSCSFFGAWSGIVAKKRLHSLSEVKGEPFYIWQYFLPRGRSWLWSRQAGEKHCLWQRMVSRTTPISDQV